jgi:hypothetical protein
MDIATFEKKFEINSTFLVNNTNTKWYQDIIEKIYNWKNREPFFYHT